MISHELTPEQALAQMNLSNAIRSALDRKEAVQCLNAPAVWDNEITPVMVCHGCPVMDQCTAYADTGAITVGIIAGRRASQLPRSKVATAA